MATPGDEDDPNNIPPWERSERERSSSEPGKIKKDLADLVRAGDMEGASKSMEIAHERLQLLQRDIELSMREVVAHLAGGGSIHDTSRNSDVRTRRDPRPLGLFGRRSSAPVILPGR
jgi:hypothetical protein